jgi:hypothetical protein
MAREHRVEAVSPRRLWDRAGDELEQVDPMPRERLDRTVQGARLMVRDERERFRQGLPFTSSRT